MELPQKPSISDHLLSAFIHNSQPTAITTTDSSFSDLLFHPAIEEDKNSEWLSVFVEDCLSSPGNYGLPSMSHPTITKSANQNPTETLKPPLQRLTPVRKLDKLTRVWKKKKRSVMKVKANKTASIFGLDYFSSIPDFEPDPYPPLLQQSHWLADSELIFPITHNSPNKAQPSLEEKGADVSVSLSDETSVETNSRHEKKKVLKSRRCTHCQADKTPLWRQGPSGKGTLCNACGVRWLKTGALFPEYRPANSPTFVSNLHSNVLRKVLKMREARQSLSEE